MQVGVSRMPKLFGSTKEVLSHLSPLLIPIQQVSLDYIECSPMELGLHKIQLADAAFIQKYIWGRNCLPSSIAESLEHSPRIIE